MGERKTSEAKKRETKNERPKWWEGVRHPPCPVTTRKTSSCGGPIAAGIKTAATGRLLRRVLGLPLYMNSIAAGQ